MIRASPSRRWRLEDGTQGDDRNPGREKSNMVHRKRCRRYNIPGHAHEITFSCYRRRPFLADERALLYLRESLLRARRKHDFFLWAYVFMPEHVHLLICPRGDAYSISAILQSIKQPVARKVIQNMRVSGSAALSRFVTNRADRPFAFWTKGGGYDRNITESHTLESVVEYIHRNPVRRGLATAPAEWRASSAREWLEPGSVEISIDFDTFPPSLKRNE